MHTAACVRCSAYWFSWPVEHRVEPWPIQIHPQIGVGVWTHQPSRLYYYRKGDVLMRCLPGTVVHRGYNQCHIQLQLKFESLPAIYVTITHSLSCILYYSIRTIKMVTCPGKRLGVVISTAVTYIAVPTPSVTRNKMLTRMNAHAGEIRITNLRVR